MSRVVLDSVKGIAVAQANRAELPHVATLFRRAVCSLKRKWSCAQYAPDNTTKIYTSFRDLRRQV